jgi:catalase
MSEQDNSERDQESRPVLTNPQGHPVYDNQNNRTVGNLFDLIGLCDPDIRRRMVTHLSQCDEDYGRRVAVGLNLGAQDGARPAADAVGAL